jgi:hypothetical protein
MLFLPKLEESKLMRTITAFRLVLLFTLVIMWVDVYHKAEFWSLGGKAILLTLTILGMVILLQDPDDKR